MTYLFVEGPDDARLVQLLLSNIKDKRTIEYARKEKHFIHNLINTIKYSPCDTYLFFSDSDTKSDQQKKKDIITKYPFLNSDNIIIVYIEIESWYYAGMPEYYCTKNKIIYIEDANNICKEKFCSLISKSRKTKTEVLIDIAKIFDIDLARRRNRSFNEFMSHYI